MPLTDGQSFAGEFGELASEAMSSSIHALAFSFPEASLMLSPDLPSAVLPGSRSRSRSGSALQAAWSGLKQLVKSPFYALYERRLAAKVADWRLPNHVGIIMDGNRRFARQLGFRRVSEGHAQGAAKLWQVLNWNYEAGVRCVTVWCFSIENFERDTEEVEALLQLFEEKTHEIKDHDDVHAKQVRVRYIGELSLLPESLQQAIRATEEATRDYDAYQLNIAMAYGGRQEVSTAFRSYLKERLTAGDDLDDVIESFEPSSIEPYLYTSGLPEPDLIIRTSGEVRLSGFLLWQSAYSEYYFCDTHWPAFRKVDFLRAMRSYDDRHRRFGR